jgi:hypothetical protein
MECLIASIAVLSTYRFKIENNIYKIVYITTIYMECLIASIAVLRAQIVAFENSFGDIPTF